MADGTVSGQVITRNVIVCWLSRDLVGNGGQGIEVGGTSIRLCRWWHKG